MSEAVVTERGREMAREEEIRWKFGHGEITVDDVLTQIAAARADERARCAAVCREIAHRNKQESASDSARRCAEAIEEHGI
jgi:hypothetical protein